MRYLFGIFATIGLIILILVLLLRGGGDSDVKPKLLVMTDYVNSGSYAEYTIDGSVRADEEHHRVQVHVDADEVVLTTYQGYENNVTKTQTYPNNHEAYKVFLKAIQGEGFTHADNTKNLRDERGVCPLGLHGIYSFHDGTREVFRSWSTSCGTGTFKGDKAAVRELFQRQVPDYNAQTRGLRLN